VNGVTIGKNIQEVRESQNLTQAETAERVGITQAALCQIERGTRNPSLQVAAGLAAVFGCKIERFLEGT